jgi:hypothetical protein
MSGVVLYLERNQLSSDAPRFESIVRNVAYELSPRFHVADAETRRSGVPAGLYLHEWKLTPAGRCAALHKIQQNPDRCGLVPYAVILLLRWIDIDLQSRVYFG